MTAIRRWRVRATDRGASAVEFALVVPFLLLIVLGIINYGVAFSQQLALNNGVRQGARAAVVTGNTAQQTCAQVVSGVRNATGPTLAMNTADIDVTVTTQSADGTVQRTSQCGSTANPTNATTKVCSGSYRPDGTTDSIVVEAVYPATLMVPWPLPGISSTLTLTSRAVYRCEFT